MADPDEEEIQRLMKRYNEAVARRRARSVEPQIAVETPPKSNLPELRLFTVDELATARQQELPPAPVSTFKPDPAVASLVAQIDATDRKNRPQVRELQRQLQTLKLYDGKLDGGWGPNTEKATNAYLAQHQEQVAHIRAEQAEIRSREQAERVERIGETLHKGLVQLSAPERLKLEQDLAAANFKPGKVNGILDQSTYQALSQFTRQQPQTAAHLKARSLELVRIPQEQMTGLQIMELQGNLKIAGYPISEVDGKWNDATRKARSTFILLNTTEATPATGLAADSRKLQSELQRLGYLHYSPGDKSDMRVVASVNEMVNRNQHYGLKTIERLDQITNHHLQVAAFLSETQGKWSNLSGITINRAAITNNPSEPSSVALDKQGNIVGGNRPFAKADPMSTTKMMTLLTLAEMGKAGELPGGMSFDAFSARYAGKIHNMMGASHNDAPYELARLATGTLRGGNITPADDASRFVERMNQTARDIRLIDTHFSDTKVLMTRTFRSRSRFMGEAGPVGYGDGQGGQHMTAFDGARIGHTIHQRYPHVVERFIADYGPYQGKTGTGSGDYGQQGSRRSFIGINDDGSTFSFFEARAGRQFEHFKDKMSRMARGLAPRGQEPILDVIQDLGDSLRDVIQGVKRPYDRERRSDIMDDPQVQALPARKHAELEDNTHQRG